MRPKAKPSVRMAFATAAVLGLVALAGCAAPDTEDIGAGDNAIDNQAPQAELTVNRETAWNQETFRFSAEQSNDPDGSIEEYVFDFGDGTQQRLTHEDDPEVTHAYAHGGEYTVTVTVRDDGSEQTGSLTDTDSLTVAVNEEREVLSQVAAVPSTDNSTQTDRAVSDFEVFEGGDRIELDVDVQSLSPTGSSKVHIHLRDPDGNILDEETVTVDPDSSEPVLLKTNMIDEEGTYTYDIQAESGSANIEGELRVFYDENFVGTGDGENGAPA